jgi:hypothetical protein
MFWMLNVSGLPEGSVVVGVKLYVELTATVVGGLPLIVGGPFPAADTSMVNAGSAAASVPSLALITMFT